MSKTIKSNHPMDERTLAAQLVKTGNLMDLCFDESWLSEAARIEDECGGFVEAGPEMRGYLAGSKTASPELIRQMRLQSILFTELRHWMASWRLGLSFEDTYTEARQLVRRHLDELTPEQQAWVDALLDEDTQKLPTEQKTVRAQTISMLSQMLTQADRQTLARVAAQGMEQAVLQAAKGNEFSTVVVSSNQD